MSILGCRGYLLVAPPDTPTPGDPPVITSPGTISGTLAIGSALTVTGAAWTTPGGVTVTPAYQWTRDAVAISGATAAGYTTTTLDGGKTIRREIIVSSIWGSDSDVTTGVLIPAPSGGPDYAAGSYDATDYSTT